MHPLEELVQLSHSLQNVDEGRDKGKTEPQTMQGLGEAMETRKALWKCNQRDMGFSVAQMDDTTATIFPNNFARMLGGNIMLVIRQSLPATSDFLK